MKKDKKINSTFYLKNGNYNKGFFDFCKVFFTDYPKSEITFNDIVFNQKSFLELYENDERYDSFIKRRKTKQEAKLKKKIISDEIDQLVSNLSWLCEYIFHISKSKELTEKEVNLFSNLQIMEGRFYKYNRLSSELKYKLLNERDEFINKALNVLKINSDDFIDFIDKKKSGFFAQQLIKKNV
jgi:hypothetical protein